MRRLLSVCILILGSFHFLLAQPRELPPAATKTIEFKEGSKSVELTFTAVAWGPKTWDSILQGVDVGGTRRWYFGLMNLHGKAMIDDVLLKSGRYALILNPQRGGPPTISFVATRDKKIELPRNLRGKIPHGKEAGEVKAEFRIVENLIDPLEIEFQPNPEGVVLQFRYGNQRVEKVLRFL
jgi:hypothetical protein